MGSSKDTTAQSLPAWVASQLRARNLCECCSQRNADTIWAGTGQNVCWQCCEAKRSDGR